MRIGSFEELHFIIDCFPHLMSQKYSIIKNLHMKIDIQSRDFTAKQDLLDYVTEKVEKLELFCNDVISSEVCLSVEKSDTNDNKFGEIRLLIPGNDLFASARAKSFEEAISEACEALEIQIKKRKTKIISKRKDIADNLNLQ